MISTLQREILRAALGAPDASGTCHIAVAGALTSHPYVAAGDQRFHYRNAVWAVDQLLEDGVVTLSDQAIGEETDRALYTIDVDKASELLEAEAEE
jgi:hypothetical protein